MSSAPSDSPAKLYLGDSPSSRSRLGRPQSLYGASLRPDGEPLTRSVSAAPVPDGEPLTRSVSAAPARRQRSQSVLDMYDFSGEAMNPLLVTRVASQAKFQQLARDAARKPKPAKPAKVESPALLLSRVSSSVCGGVSALCADARACCDPRLWAVDVLASLVQFLLAAVIYVSSAQSILGHLDPSLVYVGVDTMLLGTALTGVVIVACSKLPWAVAAVDVGFVPLLAKMAEIIWVRVVLSRPTSVATPPGATVAISSAQRDEFVATYVVAQSIMFAAVGGVLLLLGRLRLTRLCNYLPNPVISGMLASIGVSLCKSGIHVAAHGGWIRRYDLGWVWLLGAIVLAALSIVLKQRRVPAYIATPLVLLLGTSVTYGIAELLGLDRVDLAAKYGVLFDWDDKMLHNAAKWWAWTAPSFGRHCVNFEALWDCRVVIVGACAIGALKLGIKAGSFAQLFPSNDIDADAEMRSMGAANLVAALLLTTGNAFSFTGLKVLQQLGASDKGAGLLAPVWCGIAWYFGFGKVLKFVPRMVYGALLIELGVDYISAYLVYPILSQSRTTVSAAGGGVGMSSNFTDMAALVVIVGTAVAAGLLEAIALGFLLCCAFTALRLASQNVVAASRSGRQARSTIERNGRELAHLELRSDAVLVLELQGCVFFGSAEDVVGAVSQRLFAPSGGLRQIVVDVDRCLASFDITAIAAFERVIALAHVRGCAVSISPLSGGSDAAGVLRRALEASDAGDDSLPPPMFFETTDDALEAAEEALLAGLDDRTPRAFADAALEQGAGQLFERWLSDAGFEAFPLECLEELRFEPVRHASAGENIVEAGAPALCEFCLVCAGRLRIVDADGRTLRKLGPGNAFGVADFYCRPLHGAAAERDRTLVATHDVTFISLTYAALEDAEALAPRAALRFHRAMARALGQKNRQSQQAYRAALL
ncbi:hypothetical protein M885DRAFT_588628 [Pelagophyceae sp. CCMP2097]|nr:hypothetical protein M885DRAFT_588628 [Pelagophyceae sp. CCMP2097]